MLNLLAAAVADTAALTPLVSHGTLARLRLFQQFLGRYISSLRELADSLSQLTANPSPQSNWQQHLSGLPASSITYLDLDPSQRPQGIVANLGVDILDTGTRATVVPPGYGGGSANHAKGHLLARQLGGSGNEQRNIVTLYQNPVNTPVMSGFETVVRWMVEMGQAVEYRVRAFYIGADPIPSRLVLAARGSRIGWLFVVVPNRI